MNQNIFAWLSQVSSSVTPQALRLGEWKGWLDGTWTHVLPPHELLQNSSEKERECSLQPYFLTENIVKCSSYNCREAWGLLWDPADSTTPKLLPPMGPPDAGQAPSLPCELLWFCFVFSGMVHKSHWARWDGKGCTEVSNNVCSSYHYTHIFSGSRQGHSLSQSFFAFLSQY